MGAGPNLNPKLHCRGIYWPQVISPSKATLDLPIAPAVENQMKKNMEHEVGTTVWGLGLIAIASDLGADCWFSNFKLRKI